MKTRLVGLIATLAAIAAGCGADNSLGTQDPLPSDGGTSACRGPQAELLCPATWEAAMSNTDCATYKVGLSQAPPYLERKSVAGADSIFCVYDDTSLALAGARRESKAADFCDGTSNTVASGVATEALWEAFTPNLTLPLECYMGQCHADLVFSGCPTSWFLAQQEPSCDPRAGIALGHAGPFLARGNPTLGYTNDCLYDPATEMLVGAYQAGDVSYYCDMTSLDVLFGTAVEGLVFVPDLGDAPCPADGGVSDAPLIP
jgi:hypothetical protein